MSHRKSAKHNQIFSLKKIPSDLFQGCGRHTYHRLRATVSEWKAECDSILGSFWGFTVVALARRDPDCIQVQRWDGGVLRDGNVEPILVAGGMS